MSFTYDETLPTPRDRIRHTTGDTVAPGLRSDEQLDAMIALSGETQATVDVLEGLAAQYALKPDSVSLPGGLSVSWKERVGSWQRLADQIRESLAVQAATNAMQSLVPIRAGRDEREPEYTRELEDRFWYS